MGILSWIIMGLIAGTLAKAIMPGEMHEPPSIAYTILLGIAGGVVGGFVGTLLGFGTVTGFGIRSFALAIGGSCLVLWGYKKYQDNKRIEG